MHTEYLSLLSFQGQLVVIRCISSFEDLVSTFAFLGIFLLLGLYPTDILLSSK